MKQTIIINTNRWTITSHGNGLAYEIYNKLSTEEKFLQGEDATVFNEELTSLEQNSLNPDHPWYNKSTDDIVTHLADQYF